MSQTKTTKNWFGVNGRIPPIIQGMIYALTFLMIVPWIGEFIGKYWDWVCHVWN